MLQQPTKVRYRLFDRLPLVFSTILVLFIYNFNKPDFNSVIVVKKESSRLLQNDPTTTSATTHFPEIKTGASLHVKSSQFNPFNDFLVSSINDVMMAYNHHAFNLELMELPVKTILFWNEAYGSKDYGNWFYSFKRDEALITLLNRYRIRPAGFREVKLSNHSMLYDRQQIIVKSHRSVSCYSFPPAYI